MRIIAKYELTVYEDGSTELLPINLYEEDNINLSKCSSRIGQILSIILCVKNDERDIGLQDKITDAIKTVAVQYKVAVATCNDKVSRQLGISTDRFRQYVSACLDGEVIEFKELLKQRVGIHTKSSDINAIETVLGNLVK